VSSYPPLPDNFDAGDLAALHQERDAALAALRNLVATLPKCDECARPAARAFRRGSSRWCDVHRVRHQCEDYWPWCPAVRGDGAAHRCGMVDAPEYPRAGALREAEALLERAGQLMFIIIRDDGLVLRGDDWFLNVATVFESEVAAMYRWSALPYEDGNRSRVVRLTQ